MAVADPSGGSEDRAGSVPTRRSRWRRVAPRVVTALAGVLVLFVLVTPVDHLSPLALVRIPVEAVIAAFVLIAVPERATRAVAVLMGLILGLLAMVKIADVGFLAVLDRPFDPVLDWNFLHAGVVFLHESVGRPGAIGAIVVAAILAVAVIVLLIVAAVRLARLLVRHRSTTGRTGAVLALVWLVCAVAGVQIVPDTPVAARVSYERLLQVRASLQDREEFAAEVAADAFRETPGEDLLTALRGKNVIFAFVESYGRVAIEHPELAPQIGAVLDVGNERLRTAGFSSSSAFLSSPTAGGGSWLAQATLLSGVWVNNQPRYRDLVASDRLSLGSAFQRANWRTVALMPGLTQEWPEGAFFGYDRIYTPEDLGYRGPKFSFATMPDQYTLSAFERLESATGAPVMAVIPLVSSHAPWAPVPPFVGWDDVGDGSGYDAGAGAGDPAEIVWGRDASRVRADYRHAIEYSLNCLISYVETYGDDDLVLVFLGDHQPAPVITGDGASRDVPISIVTRDRAIVERIAGWGWQDGLRPGPRAPVWPMQDFRDRFLGTFSAAVPATVPPPPR